MIRNFANVEPITIVIVTSVPATAVYYAGLAYRASDGALYVIQDL